MSNARCSMKIYAAGRQAALVRSASNGAVPQRIADSAEAIWLDVDSVLTPIIGPRGVSALYRRSLHLVHEEYPWLEIAEGDDPERAPFTGLGSALARQSTPAAAAANGALLEAFYNLLANLIGEPLTTRLLQPALDKMSAEDARQDIAS
jgi:hypothetical protein